MNTITALVKEFLSQPTIAVVGVSTKKETPANAVYKKLKSQHRTVVPVNPHLETYDGDPCYGDLGSVPVFVDAVFISTRPEVTEQIVEQCIDRKIPRIWMHNSMGIHRGTTASTVSSVSHRAVERCRENNIAVIAGACPLMFIDQADGFHKFLKWILSISGKLKLSS
jgi:predicted CoA-binding protein